MATQDYREQYTFLHLVKYKLLYVPVNLFSYFPHFLNAPAYSKYSWMENWMTDFGSITVGPDIFHSSFTNASHITE